MISNATADTLRRRQPDLAGRLFSACLPARLFGPGLKTRLAARVWAASLDRELAAGADPAECPQLAARAAYLTCRETRARLATSVEHFVTAAELPPGRMTVRPARGGVRANRAGILELAARLRDDAPVYARGVAECKLMLSDGAGPAYVDGHGEALARELGLIFAGLRG
ncbi:MAG TPA: hypothetical protein VIK30_16570 [Polyangia bacterium]|jgi:hypothetical protein